MQESEKSGKQVLNILVGFSGSVATIKDLEVIKQLKLTDKRYQITAVYTKSAQHFRSEER